MCPLRLAAAKIPSDWSELLDQRAQDQGKSRSKIIQQAIAQYLDQPQTGELTLVSLALEVENLKKAVVDLESLFSEIALLQDQITKLKQDPHPIPKPVPPTDNNDQSKSARLVNGRNDYRSLVNQFLNRQRLGQQSSKAKFLSEFVKYLESQG